MLQRQVYPHAGEFIPARVWFHTLSDRTASGLSGLFPASGAWGRRPWPFSFGGRPGPPLVGRMPFLVSDFASGSSLFFGWWDSAF